MKSKKIVRVELKSPALRRIRKNFRDIIELVVKHESSKLFAISKEYRERSSETTDPVEKERLGRRKEHFRRKSDELYCLLTDSIIQCGLGGGCLSYIEATDHGFYPRKAPANLNMVWMPSYNAWFCNKCCEIIIEGDKMFRKERHPDHMRLLKEHGLL